MKKLFNLKTLLYWLVCIGTYLMTAALYPYNFYLLDVYTPKMTFLQLLTWAGIMIGLGTVMFLLLMGLNAIGKWIAMKKNLILYFLYTFVFCTAYTFGTDYFLDIIKIEPHQLFLLLGFFPALLFSIIYSYYATHQNRSKEKA